jgi:hypothetical protein
VAEQSKTVDTALTLLTLLAEHSDEPSAASLARVLGLSRTAVARMLATLEAHGWPGAPTTAGAPASACWRWPPASSPSSGRWPAVSWRRWPPASARPRC